MAGDELASSLPQVGGNKSDAAGGGAPQPVSGLPDPPYRSRPARPSGGGSRPAQTPVDKTLKLPGLFLAGTQLAFFSMDRLLPARRKRHIPGLT